MIKFLEAPQNRVRPAAPFAVGNRGDSHTGRWAGSECSKEYEAYRYRVLCMHVPCTLRRKTDCLRLLLHMKDRVRELCRDHARAHMDLGRGRHATQSEREPLMTQPATDMPSNAHTVPLVEGP
jgi:hypothetical protein